MSIANALRKILADVERVERERDEAQVRADRAAREIGDLEDRIAVEGERAQELADLVTWFAEGGGSVDRAGVMRARAVLLGMVGESDEAVSERWAAWSERSAQGRTEAA